jgi:hypothetical protein
LEICSTFTLKGVSRDAAIFGSTNEYYCKEFGKLMSKEFEMSMTGELTFFLGFQVM